MVRTVALVGLALAAVGGAVAGTVVPINLTTSTVYSNSCGTLNCVPTLSTGTVGTFENQLFSTLYGGVAGLPTPSSSAQNTSNPASVPFVLAQQSASPFNDEFVSAAASNTDTEISIDLGSCIGLMETSTCGVQNVDSVYAMIQGSGTFGQQGMVVTLTGQNSGGTAISQTILLTSGVDYRSTKSNVNQTCDVANPSPSAPGTACTGTVNVNDTTQTSGLDSNPGGTLPGATVRVYNNAFGILTNTTRNYYFDVQQLSLGSTFLNGGYLDSISIENFSGATATQMVLNGLSLDVVTPEPSTFMLLGLGAGLLALAKIRANRSKREVSE